MGDGAISRVSSAKFLGIYIDENLNFHEHVGFLATKIAKTVGILNKVKYFLPKFVLHKLYNSLIEPYIRYGIEVWGNAAGCYLDRVVKFQKSALRAIHNLPFDSHTSPYFKQSNILTVSKLFKFHVLLLTFKAVHFNRDPSLFNHAVTHSQVHTHFTRHSENLLLPRFHLSNSQKFISYAGPKLWNELPVHLKMQESLNIFKRKLLVFLIQN